MGHEVVHDTEDALLHLASVLGPQDSELLFLEVHYDGSLASHILCLGVSREFASIKDCEVNTLCKILRQLLVRGTDEHLLHEEGVIRSGCNNSALQSVRFVPTSIAVDNKKL